MRAKTVIANREPQPLLRRGARAACRPSHVALIAPAEESAANVPRPGQRKEGIRTLIVSMLLRHRSSGQSGHDRVPFLRVSGRWLEECGFAIGARYFVTVTQGRLILTLAQTDGADEPMAE